MQTKKTENIVETQKWESRNIITSSCCAEITNHSLGGEQEVKVHNTNGEVKEIGNLEGFSQQCRRFNNYCTQLTFDHTSILRNPIKKWSLHPLHQSRYLQVLVQPCPNIVPTILLPVRSNFLLILILDLISTNLSFLYIKLCMERRSAMPLFIWPWTKVLLLTNTQGSSRKTLWCYFWIQYSYAANWLGENDKTPVLLYFRPFAGRLEIMYGISIRTSTQNQVEVRKLSSLLLQRYSHNAYLHAYFSQNVWKANVQSCRVNRRNNVVRFWIMNPDILVKESIGVLHCMSGICVVLSFV